MLIHHFFLLKIDQYISVGVQILSHRKNKPFHYMNGVALGRCQINIRPRGYWILEGYIITVTGHTTPDLFSGTSLNGRKPKRCVYLVDFIVLKTIQPIKNFSVETKQSYFYFTLQRLPDFEDASQFFPSPVFECHKLLGKKIDIYLSSLCVHYLHLTDCHQTALIYDTLLHTFLVC